MWQSASCCTPRCVPFDLCVPTPHRNLEADACGPQFKDLFARSNADGKIQPWQQLIAGAGTGVCSTLLNNPIDVAKSRLQAQDTAKGVTPKYTGTVQCLATTVREGGSALLTSYRLTAEPTPCATDGFMALYRGTIPRMLKVSAGQALTFFTYDHVSSFLYSVAPPGLP